MSLGKGFSWSHDQLKFTGYSLAGISTSLVYHAADVAFDVAQGLPFHLGTSNFLITHAHMDHAAGIPYVISQKAMTAQNPPRFFMLPHLIEPFEDMMRIWQKIEGHTYKYEFIPTEVGHTYDLKGPYFFRPFKTWHRVPSQGYTIFQHKKRLREDFHSLSSDEIVQLRKKGQDVHVQVEEPLVSFTGDTQIEFLNDADFVRQSRVLFMEVTYADDSKPIARAREWGHIHLDELIPRLPEIQAEKIVLIHFSARYSTAELREILEKKLPPHEYGRVVMFPR